MVNEITGHLMQIYNQHSFTEYREPFMGGGAVCFQLLQKLFNPIRKVWINDLDRGIYAIWWATINDPGGFKKRIRHFKPSTKSFYAFRQELLDKERLATMDVLELAMKKLAVHQMSYSGLGTMAGGPIGGKTQKSSRYTVDCRWSPQNVFRNIDKVNRLLMGKEVTVTCVDYKDVLKDASSETAVYLDPPYFEKGPELYQFCFTENDHRELHTILSNANFPWLLSYDDHNTIRELYRGCTIIRVPISYTIKGIARTFELLIMPPRFATIKQTELGAYLQSATKV